MAVPTLILAPFAAFIGGLVTKVADFFINVFTKKFLIAAALIVAAYAALASIFSKIDGYLTSLDVNSVPSVLLKGISLLPSNTMTCITIILSVKIAVFIYNSQLKIISIKAAA